VDTGMPVDRRGEPVRVRRCAGEALVTDGQAKGAGPRACRPRERTHRQAAAGVAREGRAEDAFDRAGHPMREPLRGAPSTASGGTRCGTARSSTRWPRHASGSSVGEHGNRVRPRIALGYRPPTPKALAAGPPSASLRDVDR
jgi:hypothetical protein